MKKLWVGALVLVAITGVYLKYKPTAIYYLGEIRAAIQRGQVANAAVYRLDVPWHRQEHSLSCELASLKMALSGVGLNIPEQELINSLSFDPTPKSSGIWGDPYTGFVGDINGKMMRTGYGVYWNPIAKVGLGYVRTDVLQSGSIAELIYHLHQGRPVIVWGYYGSGEKMTWKTPQGKEIHAVDGEHARVLIGYTGSSLNPEKMILLDPIYGEVYMDALQFLENWSALENGAVAVSNQAKWVKTENDNTVWEIDLDMSSRRPVTEGWDAFIANGGVGAGIKVVSKDWLESIPQHDKVN